jgi:hypothetical protein
MDKIKGLREIDEEVKSDIKGYFIDYLREEGQVDFPLELIRIEFVAPLMFEISMYGKSSFSNSSIDYNNNFRDECFHINVVYNSIMEEFRLKIWSSKLDFASDYTHRYTEQLFSALYYVIESNKKQNNFVNYLYNLPKKLCERYSTLLREEGNKLIRMGINEYSRTEKSPYIIACLHHRI